MKYLKKILTMLICAAFVVTSVQIPISADGNTSYVIFGDKNETSGMKTLFAGEIVEKDGVKCAVINSAASPNLDFLASSAKNLSDGSCYRLDITYYDEGNGYYMLSYDGYNGVVHIPKIEIMQNSCTWQTRSYILEKPKFASRISGADIRIASKNAYIGSSNDNVYVSKVQLTKLDYTSNCKVEITTPRLGNVYFSDEELTFDIKASALMGMKIPEEGNKITYEIIEDEKVIWSEVVENQKIKTGKIFKYTPEFNRYGTFYLRVTISNEEKKYRSSGETYFAYAKNARKNPEFGVGTHHGHRNPNPQLSAELISKGGFGVVRDSFAWSQYEKTKGIYDPDALPELKQFYQLLKEKDIEIYNIFAYGNVLYGMESPKKFPRTPEAVEGYANFAAQFIKDFDIDYAEIYNEPEQTGMGGGCTGEEYGTLASAAYKKIKEVRPDLPVVALCFVAMGSIPTELMDKALDVMGDNYDMISLHPYQWLSTPKYSRWEDKIQNLEDYLEKRGMSDVKAVWSEIGWGGGQLQPFDEEGQAACIVQSYMMSKQFRNFDKYIDYEFQNSQIDQSSLTNGTMGMINHWNDLEPWKAKKGFVAGTNLNDIMSGAEYVGKSDKDDRSFIYQFKNDGEDLYTLFAKNESTQTALKTNKEFVTVTDMYGNESTLYAVDGVINLVLGNSVIYIKDKNLELSFTEPTIELSSEIIEMVVGDKVDFSVKPKDNGEYKINVLPASDNVIVENVNENNFKISVDLKTITDEKIILKAENDKGVCMDAKININLSREPSISISNKLYSYNNYNRWVGILNITNNSNQNSIKGKFIFNEPMVIAKRVKSVDIPEIKPGETKRIEFHLPEIFRKELYNVDAIVKLDSGQNFRFTGRMDFGVTTYADTKPVIDGKIDENEWRWGSALALDSSYQAINLGSFMWGGVDDLSGEVCLMYDEDYMYFAAKVKDDTFFQEYSDTNIWQGDSVQCAFANDYVNGNPLSGSFTSFGAALTPEGEKIIFYNAEDPTLNLGELDMELVGAECKINKDGEFMVYEIKMPWSQIVPPYAKIRGGGKLGFSMLINDNDGLGRKGWLEYASGIGMFQNVKLFTQLKFMEKM